MNSRRICAYASSVRRSAKGFARETPACAYFAATFERVFGEMLGPTLSVTEVECAAMGATACVFEVRW